MQRRDGFFKAFSNKDVPLEKNGGMVDIVGDHFNVFCRHMLVSREFKGSGSIGLGCMLVDMFGAYASLLI